MAPFEPIVVVGDLMLRVYPIRNADRRCFIAGYYVSLTITNGGAWPGRILGLRLVALYPKLTFEHREVLPGKFEVDGAKYLDGARDRFAWKSNGVTKGHWMPLVLLPKTSVTQHVLFETTWVKPVIQELIDVGLELRTDS